jgi:hypothetical protein
MEIIGKCLSLEEFKKYVKEKDFGSLPPTFMVLHHTWKPTKADWQGEKTLLGIKRYYEGKGWNAGPHLFIAEDGIWLFTDMYDVGIHAGVGNGSLKTGYSIGIEVVGNYDGEKWSGETKKNALGAVVALQKKLGIDESKIMFHRDFSKKSCPGWAITKNWVFSEIKNFGNNDKKNMQMDSKMKDEIGKYQDILKHDKDYKKYAEHQFGDNLDEKDVFPPLKELMSGMRDQRNYYKEEAEKSPKVVEKIVEKPVEVIKEVEKIVEKPIVKRVQVPVYKDTAETLEKLERKEKEVKELQEALKKHSGIYKILVDVKSGLQKLWNIIK